MRVAFGLDGVFADLEAAVARLATEVFRVARASDNFWERLEEIEPGAITRLAAMARQRHWEVIFLVRRFSTAGSTPQVQSQNWLSARGFERPSVFVVDRPLTEIVAAMDLDVVVDSPIEHRIEAPAQERVATSVSSIDDCLRRLCAAEDQPGEQHFPWYRRLAQSAAFFLP
jgi:hypothetical protein